eukprot:scaffold162027_cov17-Prasinocladus_malaysianus.AAC.1
MDAAYTVVTNRVFTDACFWLVACATVIWQCCLATYNVIEFIFVSFQHMVDFVGIDRLPGKGIDMQPGLERDAKAPRSLVFIVGHLVNELHCPPPTI